ncbi:hypothetical protein, partial [Gluconobacter cadivus]|uniref:hypothetical protein n=1 Tax=Gluconobacter cadivus TaxID=2728101 RepID=UPI001D1716CD
IKETRLLHLPSSPINAGEMESQRNPQIQKVFRTLHLIIHFRKKLHACEQWRVNATTKRTISRETVKPDRRQKLFRGIAAGMANVRNSRMRHATLLRVSALTTRCRDIFIQF